MCDETARDENMRSNPRREDASELSLLISAFLDGRATQLEIDRLNSFLLFDVAARDLYLQLSDLHACAAIDECLCGELSGKFDASYAKNALVRKSVARGTNALVRASKRRLALRLSTIALLIALPITAIFLGLNFVAGFQPGAEILLAQSVATIGELKNCRLNGTGKLPMTGNSVFRGQRFDLASGAMQIRFASGALAMIHGPAIFDISSRNSGFLTSGKVQVTACSERPTEFSLKTVSASAVHQCAEFDVSVGLNGRTRFDVSKGSLNVYIPTIDLSQQLESGATIEFETTSDQIVTLIESGDGTPGFHFPTIPAPTSTDLADHSRGTARIHSFGVLEAQSGVAEVLLNGKGQTDSDNPNESFYFEQNTTGSIVLDLGRRTAITMINTYSWHQSDRVWYETDKCFERAPQKYVLYGFEGDEMPAVTAPFTEFGWVRIAQVNTDDFFHTQSDALRPPQQASSIRAGQGSLGTYRFLLWDVRPSIGFENKAEHNTFYGEFDVFGE